MNSLLKITFLRTLLNPLLAFLLIFLLAFPQVIFAYPQDQLKECILRVKSNPNILGAPETSILNFCDCTLKLIVDEGKDLQEVQSSINYCAAKNFH